MKTKSVFLLRFGELFLKSEPIARQWRAVLTAQAKRVCRLFEAEGKIISQRTKILIYPRDKSEEAKIKTALSFLFGLTSYSPALELTTNKLPHLQRFLARHWRNWLPKHASFAIRVKKSITTPPASPEWEAKLGAVVNRKVNLTNPDVTIFVEVGKNKSYFYTQIIPGLGGLPVGVSGRGICLISGGIDSPVAGWLAIKRGLALTFLHFYSAPFVDEKSVEKTKKIIQLLACYQGKSTLWVIPFGEFQAWLKTRLPPRLLVVVYRRAMIAIGEKIAQKEGAGALVTGENLAQVASQTLSNLATIGAAARLPILRPLITFDKQEIINLAQKIGSYSLSVLPAPDCCSLFVPAHPAVKTSLEEVRGWEKKLAIEKWLEKLISQAKVELINASKSAPKPNLPRLVSK